MHSPAFAILHSCIWDTSSVTNMGGMFAEYGGYNNDFNKVPDVSEWNTSRVTDMWNVFEFYGRRSHNLNTVPDVSKWDTSIVKDMQGMFAFYGSSSQALDFTLDLSNWNLSNVESFGDVFEDAAKNASNWSVTIPAKTGDKENTPTRWYVGDGTKCIEPASGRSFTVKNSVVE